MRAKQLDYLGRQLRRFQDIERQLLEELREYGWFDCYARARLGVIAEVELRAVRSDIARLREILA